MVKKSKSKRPVKRTRSSETGADSKMGRHRPMCRCRKKVDVRAPCVCHTRSALRPRGLPHRIASCR